MTAPHSDPSLHVSWIRDWWHALTALFGLSLWALREVVSKPRARIAALESGQERIVTGIDEVRVAQAGQSDDIRALTVRIDDVLKLVAGSPHCHRRHFDPNDEEG